MTDIILYRGTTELWEQCVMEAKLPPQGTSFVTGQLLEKTIPKNLHKQLNNKIINQLRKIHCSQLRSGKEIILGSHPPSLKTLGAELINAALVKRVGVETAPGTPNFYSHFVPCGTNKEISKKFGHGEYYRFHIQGKIYEKGLKGVQQYVQERNKLPRYIVPLFEGGNHEVLAYSGSLITSVELMKGDAVKYKVMNSLD